MYFCLAFMFVNLFEKSNYWNMSLWDKWLNYLNLQELSFGVILSWLIAMNIFRGRTMIIPVYIYLSDYTKSTYK